MFPSPKTFVSHLFNFTESPSFHKWTNFDKFGTGKSDGLGKLGSPDFQVSILGLKHLDLDLASKFF